MKLPRRLSLRLPKKLRESFIRFVSDERGQSTTEYILILSVVVLVALKFKQKFGDTLLPALLQKVEKGVQDFE